MKISETNLAYFAGFFDGEGSVGIAKHKGKTTKRGFCFELIIQIGNSDEKVIHDFKDAFGGSICPENFRSGRGKRRN